MKKENIIFCVWIVFAIVFPYTLSRAQAPQKVNYQSVIRDATGSLVQSGIVGVRISILQGSASGTVAYSETHLATSNVNGLISMNIGSGTPVTGTFSSINWGAGPYFLKVETDPTGGTTYTIQGTSEIVSTPYALYAATSLDQAYDNGRIITADAGALEVGGIDGVVFRGTMSSGKIPATGEGIRTMWYPAKGAFRTGYITPGQTQWDAVNIGNYSFASGMNTTARGSVSTAMGNSTNATGDYSTALGFGSTASGNYSVAIGNMANAAGNSSFAMGYYTTASDLYATTMGQFTKADDTCSTAMGYKSVASGERSIATGDSCNASGFASSAMGSHSSASGDYSTAMGIHSEATGENSVAIGISAAAGHDNAISIGFETEATGQNSVAIGTQTVAGGDPSFAIGYEVIANGNSSTAMGNYVSTNSMGGSFIIGDNSTTTKTKNSDNNQMLMRFAGGYELYSSADLTSMVCLPAGGNSWGCVSDSTKKENFRPVNPDYFLGSLSKLKLGSWNYKGQDSGKFRHYGPMAQEIFRYFGKDGIGTIGCDTTLNSADMDGIMMICLQALERKTTELQNKTSELIAANQLLEERLSLIEDELDEKKALEERLTALEELVKRLSCPEI
nr:tail fiber domain-containing protein [Prolixibacteraceae bacterium]